MRVAKRPRPKKKRYDVRDVKPIYLMGTTHVFGLSRNEIDQWRLQLSRPPNRKIMLEEYEEILYKSA